MNNIMKYIAPCLLFFISSYGMASGATDINTETNTIELVAKLDKNTPPGNIAIGPDGRIFLSVHEFYSKPLRIVELLPDGSTKPYPNNEWAYAAQGKQRGGLYGVLGLNVDKQGVLWMLDTSGNDYSGRLIGWNTKTEQLHRVIYLAKPVIKDSSFLNDLAIDTTHNAIYIADTGTGSIIVVDLKTGLARRVLESADATKAEQLDMVIDKRVVRFGDQPARLGINPITIDHRDEFVYFGAMTGTSLYRIATKALLNPALTEQELVSHIQRYGSKPISDGITIDNAGNVYITAITDDAIGITQANGQYKTLIQRDDLSWPDGLAVGPDNYIYVTINELHRSPVLNGGEDASVGEFKVMRFKAQAKSSIGR